MPCFDWYTYLVVVLVLFGNFVSLLIDSRYLLQLYKAVDGPLIVRYMKRCLQNIIRWTLSKAMSYETCTMY